MYGALHVRRNEDPFLVDEHVQRLRNEEGCNDHTRFSKHRAEFEQAETIENYHRTPMAL